MDIVIGEFAGKGAGLIPSQSRFYSHTKMTICNQDGRMATDTLNFCCKNINERKLQQYIIEKYEQEKYVMDK